MAVSVGDVLVSALAIMTEALEAISQRCPPYTGPHDIMTVQRDDFSSSYEWAQEVETMMAARTGDIAREALAKVGGAA